MSQETEEEKAPRSRIYIGLEELSSKQRSAVLGLVKDLGFGPVEIDEVVVQLPEDLQSDQQEKRHGKWK